LPEKAINTSENYDMMKNFLSPDLDKVYQYSLLTRNYYSSESKHTN
jgi:hypothetical protein